MPLYLTRFSCTPETWTRCVQKPEDRRDAARVYIEAVDGKRTSSDTPSASTAPTTPGRTGDVTLAGG
jgi:hypothetical protein